MRRPATVPVAPPPRWSRTGPERRSVRPPWCDCWWEGSASNATTSSEGVEPPAPPLASLTTRHRLRCVVVAPRVVRVIALVERHRELGVVAVDRAGLHVGAVRIHGVDAAAVLPHEPAQVTEPVSRGEQPERPLAEQDR